MDGEREITFGNSGIWMTTDHLGPLVEGADEALVTRRTGPARPAGEVAASFRRNLYYFWIGRFGGALAYFFPAVARPGRCSSLFGPRRRDGWLALAALAVSFLFYIWMIPDNWYGGGGTLGNRYFLNLLPLAILLIPPGREVVVAVAGAAGVGGVPRGRCGSRPIRHSLPPGRSRHRPAVPDPSARAHDAQRPRRLHRAVAEEAVVRRHRGRRAPELARGPEGVLPVLHRQRDLRPRGRWTASRASGCAAGSRPRSSCARSSR